MFLTGFGLMVCMITVLTYFTRRSPRFGRVGAQVSLMVILLSLIGIWLGENNAQIKVVCALCLMVGMVGLISTVVGLLFKEDAEPPAFEGVGMSPSEGGSEL